MELSHSVNQNAQLSGVNSEYVAREITRNITLQKNEKKRETRTDRPWGPTWRSLRAKTLNFRWQQMGCTACQGNRDAHISTDGWRKENLECDTLLSLLFFGLFVFPCTRIFLYHFFFNCLFGGVQFLLHTQKTDTVLHVHCHSLEQRLHATSDKQVGMQTVLMLAACWLSDGSQFFNQHLPQVWQHGCDCHFST